MLSKTVSTPFTEMIRKAMPKTPLIFFEKDGRKKENYEIKFSGLFASNLEAANTDPGCLVASANN